MPVCIAGMHRSGTSMVAKLLHLAGLYLGEEEDIAGPAPDNLDGFWENTKFVKLNDRLLATAGGGWDCPRALPRDWESREEYLPIRVSAELLLAQFSGREPWGWKDPRNSVTAPFWERFFPQLPVVVCVRNPIEVVLSLQRRNHFSFELALGLWKSYAEQVLQNTSPEARLLTHYDSFFSDPDAEIRRLLSFAKLPASDEALALCKAAVSDALRHQRAPQEPLGESRFGSEVLELYAALCEEAGYSPSASAAATPDAAHGEQAAADTPVLSEVDRLRAQLAERERLERSLRSALARKTIERDCMADLARLRSGPDAPGEAPTLRTLFPELSQRLVEERDRLETQGKLSDRIAALQEELGMRAAQHARTVAELHELIRERDETIRALQAEHDRGSIEVQAKLNDRIKERDETIRTLRGELEAKTRDEQSHRALSERVAQYGLAVERTHADLQAKLYTQIEERDKTIRTLETAAQARIVERNEAVQKIHAETEARLAELDRESRRQLEAAYEKVVERDETIQRLQAEEAARIAELTGEHRRETAVLHRDLAARDEALHRLQRESRREQAELFRMQQALEAMSETLAGRDARIAALERDSRAAESSLYERLLALQEAVRTIELQRDQALEDVKWRNEQLERLHAVQVEAGALRDALNAVGAEREELRKKLDEIHRSRLWRAGMLYWRVLEGMHLLPRKEAEAVEATPAIAAPALPPAPPPAPAAEEHALAPQTAAEAPAPAPRSPETSEMGGLFDVICFPIIDWGFRFQRPQQTMSRFAAAGHRVFYVAQHFRPDGEPYRLHRITERVWEVSLRGPQRNVYTGSLDAADAEILFDSIDALRRDQALGAAVSVVQLPFWSPLAAMLKDRYAWPLVYDCMDHHAGFSNTSQDMLRHERDLFETSDLVVVSSDLLQREAAKRSRVVQLVRNGCDYEHFARIDGRKERGHRPVIGYYGAIADWFDSDLLADLAERRPDWDFLLVGSTASADLSRLSKLPNVAFTGEKPYQEIPEWLARFDVAVIPFKRIPLTEATNPVKAYEMLAGGKAVVSVPIPEMVPLAPLVRLASTPEEFEKQVEAALAEDDQEIVARRRAFARENTWERRYADMAPRVRRTFPKASLIVVTYNNVDLSRLCLESIYRTVQWPNFEVIVVDNASEDGTPDYLESAKGRYPGLTVHLNGENLGFAAANNIGLRSATGDYLVLLNNDTVSCRSWLSALIRHLKEDPSIGIIGPSTNAIGNEGMVPVGYQDLEEMPRWAAEFVRAHDRETFDIKMLAMFCLAMRREVFEKVGFLDERFGIGMFEDDDYAVRVRAAGYRVVCARDAFVHHFMKASFKKIPEDDYRRLFERNKRLFEEKWQAAWTPHQYAAH